MDLTDMPSDLPDADEDPPDFEAWESPGGLLKCGPIRERMRDVIVQLRAHEGVGHSDASRL